MAWAVVQTYGAAERKVIDNLRRQDFEAFCPYYSRPSLSVSIRGPRELPLFPCYTFVNLSGSRNWAPINSTPGVIRLLTNRNRLNPKPLYVSDEYIDSLTGLLGKQSILPIHTTVRVRQKDSPFYEMQGTVVALDKNERIKVLMSLFNRDTVVEFDAVNLEVVEES